MSLKKGRSGATLLEVLLATVIVTIIIVTSALLFPRAAKSITTNRQRFLASNFAASRMQELKTTPYALLDVTDATAANFPVSGIGDPNGCDCQQENLSTIAGLETSKYIEDSLTYTRKV